MDCCRCGDDTGIADLPVCLGCIEFVREDHRCPDCRSMVTVVVAADDDEPEPVVVCDVAHAPSCPWLARQGVGR
jgi:hypothetical protein